MEESHQAGSSFVQIIVLMGVSGSGKTTIGRLLAKDLGWPFFEGDEFHPAANIEKVSRGIPLTDEDRGPWVAALKQLIRSLNLTSQCAVVTCSALKQAYRDYLKENSSRIGFVYLKGSESLIRSRMLLRDAHFMPEDLLVSQLNVLEEPEDALTLDLALSPTSLITQIKQELRL